MRHEFSHFFEDKETGKSIWISTSGYSYGIMDYTFFLHQNLNMVMLLPRSNGNYYKLHHDEKIYKTDAAGTLTGDAKASSNKCKPLDFSITKAVFSMLL